jgi:hypothetical protein
MYIVRLVLLTLLTNVLQCGLRPLQCKGPGLFAPFSFGKGGAQLEVEFFP